jgi:hypothetical protein
MVEFLGQWPERSGSRKESREVKGSLDVVGRGEKLRQEEGQDQRGYRK